MLTTAPPTSRRAFAALPVTWAVIVLVLTLTPADEMPVTPQWKLLSFDTAAHAAVFLLLAILTCFSAGRQHRFPTLRTHVFSLVLVGCVAFGALIEILQMTMNLGRHGEWSDLISDSIGAVIGLLGMAALRRWWQ
ncbi:VanZ family protein [Hymenobacter crusticola]|uniref:VanZ family protein n=1 Tax=Hymenobacter crusticola TaxID=1770526 RepID=UPI000A36F994|nr:VanZ family protein [Hymenobacter crusticola]